MTRLEISYVKNLPTTIFIPCINLIDLKLIQLVGAAVASYEQECSMSEAIPQLQTFTFGVNGGGYANDLLKARRYNDLLVLDFTKLRTLDVNVERHSDMVVTHALIGATENLETLTYEGMFQISHCVYTGTECCIMLVDDMADGFIGLAASINRSSLSTLKRLRFW
jgi:hypothetical protein